MASSVDCTPDDGRKKVEDRACYTRPSSLSRPLCCQCDWCGWTVAVGRLPSGPQGSWLCFNHPASQVSDIGMDGYPTRLSGSGRIYTIRRNPTPVGLHVTRRIGLALITASTSVRLSAAAVVWFAACAEWLANYTNRPSRQVRQLISVHVPGDIVSRILYLHPMFVSRKLPHNRQFIGRLA